MPDSPTSTIHNDDLDADENTQEQEPVFDFKPLILYSRSLHNYTLSLWTEHRRIAEEKAQAREKMLQSAILLARGGARTTSSASPDRPTGSSSTSPASAPSGAVAKSQKREISAHAHSAPPPSERSDSDSSGNQTT